MLRPPYFDFSRQPLPCRPVNWDIVEQLSGHRALVAAVEIPSPFAIAFIPMMAVPPFESRSALRSVLHFFSNPLGIYMFPVHSAMFIHLLAFLSFSLCLMRRAVPRFWTNLTLSKQDSGGTFVGDQIYATGLYRSLITFVVQFNTHE